MPGTEDAREVTTDSSGADVCTPPAPTPWLTACEAAAYIKVRAGRLRAARVGGRRELRFRAAWLDEYLDRSAAPVEIHR